MEHVREIAGNLVSTVVKDSKGYSIEGEIDYAFTVGYLSSVLRLLPNIEQNREFLKTYLNNLKKPLTLNNK